MKYTAQFWRPAILTVMLLAAGNAAELRPCIGILDFTNASIDGQAKFLNFENRPITLSPACSLQDADRASMNGIMQGYVRMIDAQDQTRTQEANRAVQLQDNAFNREKSLNLYRTIVRGEARPLLLGADYLAAALTDKPGIVAVADTRMILTAMAKLQTEPDFPGNFMLRLAQETGATHLIYGTISDLHSKLKVYSGYGIETRAVVYQLDVLLKVADLPAQKVIYSKVYTGVLRESHNGTGGLEVDNAKYLTLIKSALAQAGADIREHFAPGRPDRFQVTPIPPRPAAAAPARTAPAATPHPAPAVPVPPAAAAPAPKAPAQAGDSVIIRQTVPPASAGGIPQVPPPPQPQPVPSGSGTVIIMPTAAMPSAAPAVTGATPPNTQEQL